MEHLVILHYPDPEWAKYIVKFKFDRSVGMLDLANELSLVQNDLSDLSFDSANDYVDAVCDRVARTFGGKWKYERYTCETISIIKAFCLTE